MKNKKPSVFDFYKTKYGKYLLIDLIRLESLKPYICTNESHFLSYFDITFIHRGEGQFYLDGEKIELKEGLVLFSSPRQVRRWKFEQVPQGYVLIFEKSFLTSFLSDSEFIDKLSFFQNDFNSSVLNLEASEISYLQAIFESMEEEIKAFKKNDEHILKALLCQVLVWLNRKFKSDEFPKETKESNLHVKKFVALVAAHFRQERNVSFYSDRLHISAGHLNELCKSILKVSAKKYLSEKVIAEAQKMLLLSNDSVAEIAQKLGFVDVSYFVRKFKSETGSTPLTFRKENRL